MAPSFGFTAMAGVLALEGTLWELARLDMGADHLDVAVEPSKPVGATSRGNQKKTHGLRTLRIEQEERGKARD